MQFTNTEVFNFAGALRGMRNPLESWHKSDSQYCKNKDCGQCSFRNNELKCDTHDYIIGKNDLALAQRLTLAGSEHAKFLRQVFVSVDITAPLYWWKEFDTYKIGTTANSTSTMHRITSKPISLDCFETGDYSDELSDYDRGHNEGVYPMVDMIIEYLEHLRTKYIATKDKRYWKELIRWLPNGWLQTRTITMSYANLRNMYFQRRHHKLTEWSVDFVNWIKTLPYAEELIMIENKDDNYHE